MAIGRVKDCLPLRNQWKAKQDIQPRDRFIYVQSFPAASVDRPLVEVLAADGSE